MVFSFLFLNQTFGDKEMKHGIIILLDDQLRIRRRRFNDNIIFNARCRHRFQYILYGIVENKTIIL